MVLNSPMLFLDSIASVELGYVDCVGIDCCMNRADQAQYCEEFVLSLIVDVACCGRLWGSGSG